ncbi:MAG: biotin transporter BioY [Methanomassiliicoccales archaeon]|nr:biotin transporter BioY [Methanomassiliicoccales archaeon]
MPEFALFEHHRQSYALRLHEWRESASLSEKLALSLLFAVLAAVAAQMRIFLPFTPVPLTGQVLIVLLAGFVLGRFGMVSMGMYLVLGSAFGWFSGAIGVAALSGLTAGYLFGFVLAAAVVGELAQRRKDWSLGQIVVVMSLAVGIIYLLGSFWLSLILGIGFSQALLLGAVPFVVVDAIKVLLASSVAYSITPRRA